MELVGRHDAIGAIRRALADGRGAVVVAAPAGGGVSAVLDAAAQQARDDFDRAIVRAAGRERESDVPAALLRELAARDETSTLGAAIHETPPESFVDAVFRWATTLEEPAALVVDDLNLADRASFDAVVHLARRVELTTLVITLGTHDRAELDGVETVELQPLSVDELLELLADRAGVADTAVARRVAEIADGSPLVAVEVARSLDDAQRRGDEPLPSFTVTATPIRHAFAHRVEGLAEATTRALCLAAAEPSGELRVIAAALRALGDSLDDLAAAEEAGVVSIADGEVRFDHPIRRSVAYHQLAPASRRAAHRALANALDAPRDAERRAAHVAAGVIEPDEEIAADLELVAEAAERRRDRLEARRWWLAAARLSPAADDAHRRRHRADATSGADEDPLAGLTKAERRVAAVVGSGATNKGAAETLYVSVKTVDAHLQSIYRKLGIGSRAELAVLVTQADLAGAPAAG